MAKAIPLEQLPVLSRKNEDAGQISLDSGAILLMDKDPGWSSFDVVKKVRNLLKVKKIGHAGTLDPAATGLLVLCTGKATKSIEQIQQQEKTYVGEICFGASTPSYDGETPVDRQAEWEHITAGQLESVMEGKFSGVIDQTVPPFSAVKVDGQRLYKKARKGEATELKTREVEIHQISLKNFTPPVAEVEIRCSKGTYIRSIAHDLGLAVDSRAHLSSLRRTAIGEFTVDEAFTVDELKQHLKR